MGGCDAERKTSGGSRIEMELQGETGSVLFCFEACLRAQELYRKP